LKEHEYAVIHINPLAKVIEEKFSVTEELIGLTKEISAYFLNDTSKLIEKTIELLYTTIRMNIRKKIALLADDVFQAIGLDKAESLIKSLLNMIEYPSVEYENIVILVTSSEGITRERIGRHRWATLRILWNMSRDGFKQLYNMLPDQKPSFDDVWRLTGGNPEILEKLYKNNWLVEKVVNELTINVNLTHTFLRKWRKHLEEAIIDPDYLWTGPDEIETLAKKLIERNLITYNLPPREQYLWIDIPPSEKDPELGIGKYAAWQTPLHREAVKKALTR